MIKKKLSKILWYGSDKDAEGNPILPALSENEEKHLEGLNEGEFYIHNDDANPAIYIRTNANKIVAIGGKEALSEFFLRKDKEDTAKEVITFEKGLNSKGDVTIGEEGYAEGFTGFGTRFAKDGTGEMDALTLRRELRVPSIVFNQMEINVGDDWKAPGGGVIEKVEPIYNEDGSLSDKGTFELKLEKGQIGAVYKNAICMGIFHDWKEPSNNATEDAEVYDEADVPANTKMSHRTYAGFTTVYFTITGIEDVTETDENGEEVKWSNKRVHYQLRPTSSKWKGTAHPYEQMNFTCYGIFSDSEDDLVKYGTSRYETRTYSRRLWKQNTWEIGASNIAQQDGDLSGLAIFGLKATGYSAYMNSLYFTGILKQVNPITGEEIKSANDRGAWEKDMQCYYYDRVSHNGSIWLCINEDGTTEEPSKNSASWLLEVEAGNGIESEKSLYGLSNDPTIEPTEWTEAMQVPTASMKYLWEQKTTTYTYKDPVTLTRIIGTYGEQGVSVTNHGAWKTGMTVPALGIVTMGGCAFIAKEATDEPPLFVYTDSEGNRLTFNDGGYILTGEANPKYDLLVESGKDGTDGTDYEYIYIHGQDVDIKPSTPDSPQTDGYVPTGWHDDPLGVSETLPVEFVCVRRKKNGLWGGYSTPAPWAKFGFNGEDSVYADIDNEMDSVALTSDGHTTEAVSITAHVSMYHGTTKIEGLTSLTASKHDNLSIDTSTDGTVTITAEKDVQLSERTEITLTATANINGVDQIRSIKFTLAGVKAGADGEPAVLYRLVVSANVIAKKKDGTFSVNGVSATRTKSVEGVTTETVDGVLKYAIDGGTENEIADGTEVEAGTFTKEVKFFFYDANGVLVDKESVPLVEDGADGTGIKSTSVMYAKTAEIVGPSTIEEWSTTIPAVSEGEYLWTRTITDYTNDNVEDTVSYTYSYQGKTGNAGTSVEVESILYQVGDTSTTAPTGTWLEAIPEVPQGKYLWSKTTFTNGKTAYGVAYQGTDGQDGESLTIVGNWKTGITVPKLGMVTMGGNAFVAKVATTNPPMWCYTDNEGNRLLYNDGGYILTGEMNTDEYELLVESGKDGSDGKDHEYIFQRTTEYVRPSTPATVQQDNYVPTGWTDNPVGITESVPYEWVCLRIKKNGLWGAYSTPSPWTKWGFDGENAILADLDNEMDNVPLTNDGKVTESTVIQTTAAMYWGSTKQTLTAISTNTVSGLTISSDKATGVVTVVALEGETLAERSVVEITVTAVINGTEYSRTLKLTVAGVKGGADAVLYDIIPSVSAIGKKKDGTYSVDAVSAYRTKTVGGTTTVTTDGTLKYSIDGGTETAIDNNATIAVSKITTKIQFSFYNASGVLVDKETVPMVADGADGEGFTVMGNWKTGMTVPKNGVVTMGGGSYVALEAVTDEPPLFCYTDNSGNRLTYNDGGYILTGEKNSKYQEWAAKGEDGKDGKDGATGAKGDKGDKGDKGATGATGGTGAQGPIGYTGCVTRVFQVYSSTQKYRNDTNAATSELESSGIRYLDVVLKENSGATSGYDAYECLKTNTGVSLSNTTYWRMMSDAGSQFIPKLVALDANIRFASSGQLVILNESNAVCAGLSGSQAGDKIRIWAGSSDPASAPFRVNQNGDMVSTSGLIGGLTISSNSLSGRFTQSGNGTTIVNTDMTLTPGRLYIEATGSLLGHISLGYTNDYASVTSVKMAEIVIESGSSTNYQGTVQPTTLKLANYKDGYALDVDGKVNFANTTFSFDETSLASLKTKLGIS